MVYTVCSVNEPFVRGSRGDRAAMKRFIRRALVQRSIPPLSAADSTACPLRRRPAAVSIRALRTDERGGLAVSGAAVGASEGGAFAADFHHGTMETAS